MYMYMYVYIYIYILYILCLHIYHIYHIYVIMKIMYPPNYHNGSVANHALGHMMFVCNIVHHLPKCMSCLKATLGTLLSWLHIYYACLTSARFDHSLYRGSIMTTYIINTYIDSGNNLIQVWNIARYFSLPCFRHLVNSAIDRTVDSLYLLHCTTIFWGDPWCYVRSIK